MDKNYEYCDWQETYMAMDCELPYDDSEPDETEDYNELTQSVDEIRIPLNPPRPAPESPYIPDICIQETSTVGIYEPTFVLFGK